MPKFKLPKSIFSTTKGLSTSPDKPSLIAPHPSVKTNKLLQDQLDFLRESSSESDLRSREARHSARLANIIAIIAIIIAIKDEILKVIILWLS